MKHNCVLSFLLFSLVLNISRYSLLNSLLFLFILSYPRTGILCNYVLGREILLPPSLAISLTCGTEVITDHSDYTDSSGGGEGEPDWVADCFYLDFSFISIDHTHSGGGGGGDGEETARDSTVVGGGESGVEGAGGVSSSSPRSFLDSNASSNTSNNNIVGDEGEGNSKDADEERGNGDRDGSTEEILLHNWVKEDLERGNSSIDKNGYDDDALYCSINNSYYQ